MQDVVNYMGTMTRPRLIVRAARIGAEEYRREASLPRILQDPRLPKYAEALIRLREIEEEMNAMRVVNDANYSLPKHIDVLISMIGETRLLVSARSQKSGLSVVT